ncbi:MAG TPA: PHP domain-containing protein [Actinomycetota bacterium]|nr:PHP domain-containing protein [Actinomycetota bacterium]
MAIDLHSHTTASDGVMSPEELVALSAGRGVTVLGVTDHDTLDGVTRAQAAGDGLGVRVVAGVELSCRHEGRSVHVLGLFCGAGLAAELAGKRGEREERARRMVARLNELGYELTFEDVLEQSGTGVVGRPHVARALVARGHLPHTGAAFTSKLIADGGLADVPRDLMSPREAVAVVRRSGGVGVLAHPGPTRHGPGPTEALIRDLAQAGLGGLEVDHPDHQPPEREKLRTLASELGLVVTGGSDCHGPDWSLPGTCVTSQAEFERLEALAGISSQTTQAQS